MAELVLQRSQCHARRGTFSKPTKHRAAIESETKRPFGDSEGLSVVGESVTGPPIAALNFASRPSAVRRLVVSVVVDAIERMLPRWTWPHVAKEVLKSPPSLADRDASPPVVRERAVKGVSAAPQHLRPRVVLSGRVLRAVSAIAALAMLRGRAIAQSGDLRVETATALGQSTHKVSSGEAPLRAAGAGTAPVVVFSPSFREGQNLPAMKLPIGKVFHEPDDLTTGGWRQWRK